MNKTDPELQRGKRALKEADEFIARLVAERGPKWGIALLRVLDMNADADALESDP